MAVPPAIHATIDGLSTAAGRGRVDDMRLSATSGAACAAALLALPGLGGCVQTATYGTGESPEMAIVRELTGGVMGGKKEAVVYQPRAPLVLPPSGEQLPPPAPAVEVAVAQWPDDPDQGPEAARQYGDENPSDDISSEDYRRLKPLGRFARAPTAARDRDRDRPADDLRNSRQQRKEFQAALNEAEGIRRERRYLTDPPDTVREPAATAPQQFEEIEPAKKKGFFRRLFTRG